MKKRDGVPQGREEQPPRSATQREHNMSLGRSAPSSSGVEALRRASALKEGPPSMPSATNKSDAASESCGEYEYRLGRYCASPEAMLPEGNKEQGEGEGLRGSEGAPRASFAEQYAATADALKQARQKYRNSEKQYVRMKELYFAARKQAQEAGAHLRLLEAQLERERSGADSLVRSVSFQLGHLLVTRVRSIRGIAGLPWELARLYSWVRGGRTGDPPVEPVTQHSPSRREPLGVSRGDVGASNRRHVSLAVEGAEVGAQAPRDSAGVLAPERHTLGRRNMPVTPTVRMNETDASRRLKAKRVAAIMDDFTFHSYAPECTLLQLTPTDWEDELTAFRPELLLVESAWRGMDELWKNQVGKVPQALLGIIDWCRANSVPTVFWNKEDPVHFETFLNAARLFDAVFTTDVDCIPRYKAALGHQAVYFLPFAAQPAIHNPIEKYPRKDAIAFAGAYYVRYPARTRDLEGFIDELPSFRPVEIFDRNLGKDDPNYMFPEKFQRHIVGTLPFSEIDRAYKGYRYAINLNSIKSSQSMFARRVYELLASNTTTLSNYSRGLRVMFGDLVLASDSGRRLREILEEMSGRSGLLDKHRLRGLRKVHREHTYQDRLAHIFSRLGDDVRSGDLWPDATMIGWAESEGDVRTHLRNFRRQKYSKKRLVMVCDDALLVSVRSTLRLEEGESAVPASETTGRFVADLVTSDWVSPLSPRDFYGANYLSDVLAATRYSDALVIGKGRFAEQHTSGRVAFRGGSEPYAWCERLPCRASVAHRSTIQGLEVDALSRQVQAGCFFNSRALSVDPFGYCRNGAESGPAVIEAVEDDEGISEGRSLADLMSLAERVAPAVVQPVGPEFDIHELASMLRGSGANGAVEVRGNDVDPLVVRSTLPDDVHHYQYAKALIPLERLAPKAGLVPFHLEAEPGLDLQLVMIFFNNAKERLGHVIKTANRNHDVAIPAGAEAVRLGLRIRGGGESRVSRLRLEHISMVPPELFMEGDYLVLTNHYPSYRNLYRNGFVHRRVVSYKKRGLSVDVMRFRPGQSPSFDKFEGVECLTGGEEVLDRALSSGRYKGVLVHFLEPAMWNVLQRYMDSTQVTVWVHGSEVQPFHRREYNYTASDDVQRARTESDARMEFWRGVFAGIHSNLHFVFVSRYFADEVMQDVGVELARDSYSIVHNPIDTEIFAYREKPASQRLKVLSIRPFASRKYANDLSVRAILELTRYPWFGDLAILIVGDGALFEETLEPLRCFDNVQLERRFLSQAEIAELHKEYGVFLCPTRMDAQGVSRDEAMASGLVPVTNEVAAIPEFVDRECGILAPAEDYVAMADGIRRLVEQPELFTRLSSAAAARVREQSSSEIVITAETDIFAKPNTSVGL